MHWQASTHPGIVPKSSTVTALDKITTQTRGKSKVLTRTFRRLIAILDPRYRCESDNGPDSMKNVIGGWGCHGNLQCDADKCFRHERSVLEAFNHLRQYRQSKHHGLQAGVY